MRLERLDVQNLRNLARVAIQPAAGLNVLFGANGSGKTSLIEAIHLLGLGRSFRTAQNKPLISHGQDATVVFGMVTGDGQRTPIGVEKSVQGDTFIKVKGARAKGAAELAALLPVQLITPESHALIDGGPRERRAYIDWGLFHVEHLFVELWQRYTKGVRQRNAALRTGSSTLPWDQPVALLGEQLSAKRDAYVGQIGAAIAHYVTELLGMSDVTFDYYPGWPRDSLLLDALQQGEERDRRLGFTGVGPHRAELRIKVGSRPAHDVLSRGQEKLLVAALRLGQLAQLRDATGKTCLLLLDDLPAELDQERRAKLLALVASTDAQCFVTATEREQIPVDAWESVKLFHVKHGAVTEVV